MIYHLTKITLLVILSMIYKNLAKRHLKLQSHYIIAHHVIAADHDSINSHYPATLISQNETSG